MERIDLRDRIKAIVPERIYLARQSLLGRDIAKSRSSKKEFFWKAFKAQQFNGIPGDYVEFGCHGAVTFRLAFDEIARRGSERHLWAFDSFAGLPEWETSDDAHPKWQPGAMSTELAAFDAACANHGIPKTSYSTIPGFYSDTLDPERADLPVDIAVAYVDCDLYSSTVAVLEFLRTRLKPGMIVAFDDYHCWSDRDVSGERRALREFESTCTDYSFAYYCEIGWGGRAFVIEPKTQEL